VSSGPCGRDMAASVQGEARLAGSPKTVPNEFQNVPEPRSEWMRARPRPRARDAHAESPRKVRLGSWLSKNAPRGSVNASQSRCVAIRGHFPGSRLLDLLLKRVAEASLDGRQRLLRLIAAISGWMPTSS